MPRMHMTYENGIFAVRTYNRDDGAAAKAAGAMWHGPHNERWPASSCEACRAGLPLMDWWYFSTRNRDRAVRLREVADEKALRELGSAVARLEVSHATGTDSATNAGAQAILDARVPAPRGLGYKPYQRAGIAFMRAARGGALLADEPGLGKTIQVLGLINAEGAGRSLVVVPASLRINWLREAVKWLVKPTRIHLVGEAKMVENVAPGSHRVTAGPSLPKDVCEGDALVIVNYDRARDEVLRAELMACRWDLFAADEAHFLKNPKAQRTIACLGKEVNGALVERGFRQASARFIAMTGTPLPNKPVEMWPVLHAVSPETFPAFFPFARRYCDARKKWISRRVGEKWDFSGASNLSELQDLMRSTCMVRRLKADVIAELPPKIRQIIALPREDYASVLGEDDMDWEGYEDREGTPLRGKAAREAFERDLKKTEEALGLSPDADDAYAYAAALLGKVELDFRTMSKQRLRLAVAKIPAVLEICDNRLEEENKIIVFAHHHAVIEKVLAHYNKKGKPAVAVAVYGPVDAQDRDAAVQAFQNDDRIRVFVGSIAAAGVGLTLTAASTVIFAEVDWVPANVAQAEDRAHRIGQKDVVNVLHVVVEKSMDARMVQILVAKANVADRALDKDATLAVPEAGLDYGAERRAKKEAEAKKYPPVSPLLRELVQLAMQRLDEQNLDSATIKNGVGFNRMDGEVGHRLAVSPDPSPGMIWSIGVEFANKYRGQLGNIADRIAGEAAILRAESGL